MEHLANSILPIISVAVSAFLLFKLRKRGAERNIQLLIGNILFTAVAQTGGYLSLIFSEQVAMFFADLTLAGVYFFFASLLIYSISLSGEDNKKRYLIYLAPLSISLLHMGGFLIESYRYEQNSFMHNDGPLAWTFDLFILIACGSVFLICNRNRKAYANDRIIASRNIIMLASFAPLLAFSCVMILLSITSHAVSAAKTFPIIIIYTSIAYYYLSSDNIADATIGLRFFMQRLQLAHKILAQDSSKEQIKVFNNELKRQLITESYFRNNGSVSAIVKDTGFDLSTIYKLLKEYSLKPHNGNVQEAKAP